MKKLILCGLALAVTFGASAQTLKRVAPAKGVTLHPTSRQLPAVRVNPKDLNIDSQLPVNYQPGPTVAAAHRGNMSINETVIGTTEYDLQANVGMGKRISNNGDGTISAVYTGSGNRNYADRGTYYNYYDGSSWGANPTARVEGATRTGWPNICVVNGVEYSIAHGAAATGLVLSTRTKGTGAWTVTPGIAFPLPAAGNDVWPRMAVGGANNQTLHVIVNSQGTGTTPVLGQSGPVTYSRSTDGGATWGINHSILPGLDSTMYTGWGADVYHIDCNGDNVVITVAESFSDVVLLKSTDNGTTWTKTVVQASPIPMYDPTASGAISDVDGDGVADTVETSTGDVTVTIDNNGVAHLAWVQMRYIDDDTTADAGWSYFPGVDGIVYWNENMAAPVIAAGAPDLDGDGNISIVAANSTCRTTGYYGGSGLSAHPSIGYDLNGFVYMSYSSICELADTSIFTQSRRHVYAVKSGDGGNTWSDPLALVKLISQGGDGEFQECVFGSMAKLVDGDIHVLYQRDDAPGYSLLSTSTDPSLQCQAANNVTTNDIVYVKASVADFVGVAEITSPSASFSITQNYPNPFNGQTRFDINLQKSSDVSVEVYSVVGNLVKTMNMDNMASGVSTITVDASDLSAGVYTYTVKVGAEKLTRSMIVK